MVQLHKKENSIFIRLIVCFKRDYNTDKEFLEHTDRTWRLGLRT